MNIGEYLRETMSVTAYDALIDRLAAMVAEHPPDPEDGVTEALPVIEERLQREAERAHRFVRTQWRNLDPYIRPKTREQGRHLAYCRLDGQDAFEVVERIPRDDGSEIGSWHERRITRVFWQATERRWRCGCQSFVRTHLCEHVATLTAFTGASRRRDAMHTAQLHEGLCSCGSPEFVGGLCYVCHLLLEQRWSEQWCSARRAQALSSAHGSRGIEPARVHAR